MGTKQQIKILTKAQKLIKSHEHNYVCVAISYLINTKNGEDCKYLHKWIKSQLGHHIYLDSWVREKIGSQKYRNSSNRSYKMRNTRLAWIDWMISELKKK